MEVTIEVTIDDIMDSLEEATYWRKHNIQNRVDNGYESYCPYDEEVGRAMDKLSDVLKGYIDQRIEERLRK